MFNSEKLIICILGTTMIFSWLFFYRESKARLFFLFFAVMYLIYAGVGSALQKVYPTYIYYYFVFTACINVGIYTALHNITNNRRTINGLWNNFLTYFIDKYATKIIIIYLGLCLLPLIYPEFKLINLIKPPAPDVIAMLGKKFQGTGDAPNVIISIANAVRTLLYPFYLFSLYKYGAQTLKLILIVILPCYFEYCSTAYIGRGTMLECILYIIAFTYFCRPKLAKPILIGGLIAFPALIIFFVQYSITRIGGTASSIGFGDALGTLFEQESGYPEHFTRILQIEGKHFWDYFLWLFTIPLPGIVRGGVDVHFAALFSEDMLGIDRTTHGFYILLPGVVGESVYLLGKNLFWINGLIYGFLMGACYRFFTRYPQLLGLLIASAVDFGYTINRAGLFGGIPFILKLCVYFYIILWLFKRRCKYKNINKLKRSHNTSFSK